MNRQDRRVHEAIARQEERKYLRREARATLALLFIAAAIGAAGVIWLWGEVWRTL